MHRQWSELNCKLVLLCVCFLCIPRRHRIIWKRLPVARRRGMDDNENDKDDDCMLSEMIPLIHCTAVNWWCTDASLNIDYTTQSQWLLRKTNNNIGRFLFCQKKNKRFALHAWSVREGRSSTYKRGHNDTGHVEVASGHACTEEKKLLCKKVKHHGENNGNRQIQKFVIQIECCEFVYMFDDLQGEKEFRKHSSWPIGKARDRPMTTSYVLREIVRLIRLPVVGLLI